MDLISRQDAINVADAVWSVTGDKNVAKVWDQIKDLPSAQPEQRWIPTSEKLPEYDKPVLLSTAWGKTEIGFLTQRGWMIVACSYREFEQDAVVAWMPLPEPWKGDTRE